jgi:hypothetical protein
LVNLIYPDRLNAVPLDQSDPQAAIDEVCQRFADIIGDHLTLESILLSIVGTATGRNPGAGIARSRHRGPRRGWLTGHQPWTDGCSVDIRCAGKPGRQSVLVVDRGGFHGCVCCSY